MAFSIELLFLILVYGLLSGGGIILVRIGFKKTDRKGVNFSLRKPLHQIKLIFQEIIQMLRIKEFVFGAALMIIGFFLYQVSLKDFSASDVRPLTSMNLVFVVILSKSVLREKFKLKEVFGIISSFCALISISITAQESTNAIITTNFYVTVIILGLFICFSLLGLYAFKFGREYMMGVLNGGVFSIGTIANKAFLTEISIAGNDLSVILHSPFFYIFVLAYGLGVFTTLVLLGSTDYRVSVMTLVSNVVSLVLVIALSLFIFNESLFYLPEGVFSSPISLLKIFGIILAGVSLILLYSPAVKENRH